MGLQYFEFSELFVCFGLVNTISASETMLTKAYGDGGRGKWQK